MSDDLFAAAMLAYDAEGRHSEGIAAIIDLVRSWGRVEARVDPSASRIRITSGVGTGLLRTDCLSPGCGWHMKYSSGAQRLGTIVKVCADHPCTTESRPQPDPALSAPSGTIPPGWWYEASPGTPFPERVAKGGRFSNAWPGGWATLVASEHFAQFVVERGRRYLRVSEYDAVALDRARPAPGSVFGYESHDRTMRIGPLSLDTIPDHRDAAQGIVLLRILNGGWALYATGPAPLDSEPVEP